MPQPASRTTTRLMPAAAALAVVSCWVSAVQAEDLAAELKAVKHKIVYETYRGGNWELFLVNADGSHPVNLTRTPDADEMYPHASPDGTKICFVADEGQGDSRVRNVYYMGLDGSGRTLVARNARQPFWNSSGTAIAYLKGEFDKFTYSIIANKGLVVYDLASRKHQQHPNGEICHLFNVSWSPDDKWFAATVHAGMGYKHGLIAIEADGMKVLDLGIPGCRPEFSPDGKKIAWTPSDWALRVGDLDLSGGKPKVTNQRDVVTSSKPIKVYHIDWSPDGRYAVFTRGPATKSLKRAHENVGTVAEGWDICIADVAATNRWTAVTSDGNSNKEPDWVFVPPTEKER